MTFETDQADPPRQRISRRKVFERRREQECKRPTPLVPDWLYDTHQVALFTGRSVSSIDKDASCGTGLPWIRVGKLRRYRGSDIMAAIKSCRVYPQGGPPDAVTIASVLKP